MLTAKERKWLDLISTATAHGSGLYDGERADLVPAKIARKFESSGWVERVYPHNRVHKDRFVITSKGLDALKQQ